MAAPLHLHSRYEPSQLSPLSPISPLSPMSPVSPLSPPHQQFYYRFDDAAMALRRPSLPTLASHATLPPPPPPPPPPSKWNPQDAFMYPRPSPVPTSPLPTSPVTFSAPPSAGLRSSLTSNKSRSSRGSFRRAISLGLEQPGPGTRDSHSSTELGGGANLGSVRRGSTLSGPSRHSGTSGNTPGPAGLTSSPSIRPPTGRKSWGQPKRQRARTNPSAAAAAAAAPQTPSQYYRDPSTRLMLRQCLSSPQNFEDALEFGFPTLANQADPHRLPTSAAPPRKQSTPGNDMHRFLRDERLSFLDGDASATSWLNIDADADTDADGEADEPVSPRTIRTRDGYVHVNLYSDECGNNDGEYEDDSDEPSPVAESPTTPHGASEPLFFPLMPASPPMPRRVAPQPPPPTKPSVAGSFGPLLLPESKGREMTLRMTLTKPEFRAPEEHIYAFQQVQYTKDAKGGAGLEFWGGAALDDTLGPLDLPEPKRGWSLWNKMRVRRSNN